MRETNHSIDVEEVLYSDEEKRTGLPFFVMLIGVLIVLYIMAIVSTPSLRQPAQLIPLTLLFVTHGVLYIWSLTIQRRRRLLMLYIIVQAVIVLIINHIVRGEGYVLGLYLALAGEVVGFYFQELKRAMFWVTAILLLAVLNFGLLWGWSQALGWLAWMVPMSAFVVVYVTLFSRQARARVVAQALVKELAQAQRQLEAYAAQVETLTLANERQRIARELHDTLAQGLVGVILQLEAVEARLLNDESQQALSLVGQAKERARGTLAEARSAIRDLREREQTPEEFKQGVAQEIHHFSEAMGIDCELKFPEELTLSTEICEHVGRMIAEGLANTARHAQASKAWVHLEENDGELQVEVGDNGRGFNPQEMLGKSGHYGLIGLRERARHAGGSLEIVSAPGQGAAIRMRLPINGETSNG